MSNTTSTDAAKEFTAWPLESKHSEEARAAMKVGHAAIKSAHSLILNRLHQMQTAPCYASAREELGLAESTIVELEDEVKRLREELNKTKIFVPCHACLGTGEGKHERACAVCGGRKTVTKFAHELQAELSRLAKERGEARDVYNEGVWITHQKLIVQRDALQKELNKASVDYFELIAALTGGTLKSGDDVVEIARSLRDNHDALQKDNEALQTQASRYLEDAILNRAAIDKLTALGDREAQLQKDNERLREAVRKIALSSQDEEGCYYTNRTNIGIARAALEAKP